MSAHVNASHRMPASIVTVLIFVSAAILLTGCAELGQAVGEFATISDDLGIVDSAGSTEARLALQGVKTLGDVVNASNSPFTPEQEHYVGRSVAATILRDYPAYDDNRATVYVNRVGQALALASERPQLYLGYTFMILDTDEINAFATPGGHIFITRGMLALTASEDELAAVLAHEIAHVAMRHGLGSIRTSRVITAVQDGMFEALDTVTDDRLQEVTAIFGDATADVVDTLVTRGYSGSTEREADGAAVDILRRVGYDPYALIRVLENMDAAQEAQYEGSQQPRGFSKTHPRPQSRVSDLESDELRDVEPGGRIRGAVARERYRSALGGI
ncbi:MAG: M48 family metalloprotease [Spirochaetota bacterium]